MKTKILSHLIFILLLVSAGFKSEAQLTISGELRPRFEFRNGYKRLPDSTTSPAYLTTQRTRLAFGYKAEKLNAKITIHDVRTWGDEKLKEDTSSIGVYEAWAEIPVCDSIWIKAGRQELIYDNERILSNNNWQQRAVTHDAALLKYRFSGWKFDLACAFNQTGDPIFGTDYPDIIGKNNKNTIKNNYKVLSFLFINKKIGDLNLSLVALTDGFQKRNDKEIIYMRKTAGATLKYYISGIGLTIRGYYQAGKDTAGTDIEAFYLNPEIFWGYKKAMLNIGMEYVSGNDTIDKSQDKVKCFSTLYGTGHQFMGHMDYFTDIPKDTKKAGLIDIYLKTNFKMDDRITLKADYHYFMLTTGITKTGETVDKALGHELDFNCKYDFSKEISLLFGYSVFKGTETNVLVRNGAIQGLSGGGDEDELGHWAFVMLTVKPVFFSSK
jgi:predicted porin